MSYLRPSAPRFLPGTLLGARYRVERLLAEGAMGMVLQATDVTLGKQVAIKLRRAVRSRPSLAGRAEASPESAALDARFAHEARIAGQLAGEHLARVDGAGHTDAGDPFLVMELLSGRDLAAELAARGPLPVAEAVDAILEASAGVAEAHAAGLVHRDLKPANLFVERRRGAGPRHSIKVLDFGLTRVPPERGQVDLAATESDFGTPQYMAPEQVRSSRHVDARTDQHALGAVLHELLTGAPPFRAADVTQLAVAIAVAPPPHARAARPEVPPALDAAVHRALAKRPDDRFPDLLAFAEAVAPFGGERAREALRAVRAASAVSADRGRARRGPIFVRISMTVCVAVLAALGAYLLLARCLPPAAASPSAPATAPASAPVPVPKPPGPTATSRIGAR